MRTGPPPSCAPRLTEEGSATARSDIEDDKKLVGQVLWVEVPTFFAAASFGWADRTIAGRDVHPRANKTTVQHPRKRHCAQVSVDHQTISGTFASEPLKRTRAAATWTSPLPVLHGAFALTRAGDWAHATNVASRGAGVRSRLFEMGVPW